MKTASGAASAIRRLVHLVRAERLETRLALVLLAHRHPDVGVDRIGARDRLGRIGDDRRRDVVDVPRRGGEDELHPRQARRLRQRAGDVVAVPHERDLQPLERAEVLPQREDVGQRLARVVLVGERVDDGPARSLGQLVDRRLREGAHHDRRGIAGERPRRVAERLASPELQLVGAQDEREHPEPLGRGREGDARARRGLLEEADDGVAAQRVDEPVRPLLHRHGEVEQRRQTVRVEVRHAEEVVGDGRCVHGGHEEAPFSRARAGVRCASWTIGASTSSSVGSPSSRNV